MKVMIKCKGPGGILIRGELHRFVWMEVLEHWQSQKAANVRAYS